MQQLSKHDRAVLSSIFNPLLPLGESPLLDDEETGENDDDDEVLEPEIAELQKRAIYETEKKNYDEARRLFDEALKRHPRSPKILNDRAQLLRLTGHKDEALADLDLAIRSSNGEGKAATKAFCQRGILRKVNGRIEDARSDFEKAAKNGSKFARNQLVEMNPYAAMCNQMLREMTLKLSFPETVDKN